MHRERWLVLAGLLLFLASLLLPAVTSDSFPTQNGFDLLRQRGEFVSNGIYAWYANPVIAVALALGWFGRYRLGLAAAVAGTLLALSTFAAPAILEQAGRSLPVFAYGMGFYLWLAAFLCAIGACGAGWSREIHARAA